MTLPRRPQIAILVRRSAERKGDTSVSRQIPLCESYAETLAGDIVSRHVEIGVSGATTHGRSAIKRLLAEIEVGLVDTVVVEAIDRLARSEYHLHGLAKTFAKYRVTLHVAGQAYRGEVDIYNLAFQGYLAELERADAMRRTRDGRMRAATEGRINYGCIFGYEVDRALPGVHHPHPVRAPIVVEVFRRWVEGDVELSSLANWIDEPTPGDCLEIARGRPPKGGRWTARKVAKLLRTAAYLGILVDGKTESVRDPFTNLVETIRSISPKDWTAAHVPEMALVSRETWLKAQELLDGRRSLCAQVVVAPRKMLTGLVHCGHCGVRVPNHKGPQRFRCATPGCEGFGQPSFQMIETAVLTEIAAAATCDAAVAPSDGRETLARFAREREEIESKLDADLGAVAVGGRQLRTAEREKLERRSRALRLVLEDPDLTDLTRPLDDRQRAELADRIRVALAESRSDALPGGSDSLAEAARRCVQRVEIFLVDGDLHVVVEIDAFRLRLSADRTETEVVEAIIAEPVETESNRRSRIAMVRERRSQALAVTDVNRLPSEFYDRIARVDQTSDLFGWTLPGLVEAVSFRRRSGCAVVAIPSTFGPTKKFDVAMAAARSNGMRGELAHALVGIGPLFSGATTLLYHRRTASSAMSEALEMQLAQAAIERLRKACRRDSSGLKAVARIDGCASMEASDDVALTRALAAVRLGGGEGLLDGPLPTREELLEELAASTPGPKGWRTDWLEAVRRHLQGKAALGFVEADAVRRYRACGPSGLSKWVKTANRLDETQLDEIRRLVANGYDPDDPSKPLNSRVLVDYCATKFGCLYRQKNLLEILVVADIRLSRDSGYVGASKVTAYAKEIAALAAEIG